MSDKIFIPELWEDKSAINLEKYALKSDLNNFHLKNTNINMNDNTIENIKIGGINDAVNKSFVENRISSVISQIPYMTVITESVSISQSSRSAKLINKNIENPIFNGLKHENILLFVNGKIDYSPTDDTLLSYTAKVISITNNTINININIKTEYIIPADVKVEVYLYILIIPSMTTSSVTQNGQPSNRKSPDISRSYF
jgi:hypothetical protein